MSQRSAREAVKSILRLNNFKHFARLELAKRLDLPRELSAHGARKEVSVMQASSRDRARRPRTVGCGSEDLARDVASLPALDTAALRERWEAPFGADPSPRVGRSLLISAIAYRLQERALGGLKPATQ